MEPTYSIQDLKQNEVAVTIEYIDRHKLVFDFYNIENYKKFLEQKDFNKDINHPSMVYIDFCLPLSKRIVSELKEGDSYVLDIRNLKVRQYEDSYLIGYIAQCPYLSRNCISNIPKCFSMNEIQKLKIEYTNSEKEVKCILKGGCCNNVENGIFELSEKISKEISNVKIVVRDVGQGNLNEIYINNELAIVYDFGTYLWASKQDVDALYNKFKKIYNGYKPFFILSHWDKDHYHILRAMLANNDTLFSKYVCICPLQMTATAQSIYNGLSQLMLQKIQKQQGRHQPVYQQKNSFNNIFIYEPSHFHDINDSELIIVVKKNKNICILTGDSNYEQIVKVLKKDFSNDDINIVLPHHGGNAGNVQALSNVNLNIKRAIVSRGINRYRHPTVQIQQAFTNYEDTFILHDIEISL